MAYDNMEQFPYKDGYSDLIYDGVNLGSECEMFILGRGTFNAPARDVEQIHVPGRNGDILIDNGGWNNVDLTYPDCAILSNFSENAEKLRGHLLSKQGYRTLIDPYHPDEVRYAEFRGPFAADAHTGNGNESGTFDLNFNCRPQRFLLESTNPISYVECPSDREEYTSYYQYGGGSKLTNNASAGMTFEWTFNTLETITIVNGYFYRSSVDHSMVNYDGPTVFENGKVSIPLVGKNGTKYFGFTGSFRCTKTSDFRMVSSNAYNDSNDTEYFYFKDRYDKEFCFPFYNPTLFDAYPIIKGSYKPDGRTYFSNSLGEFSINNTELGYTTSSTVEVDVNGVERTAKTTMDGKDSYGGLSGDFPAIPPGTSVLVLSGASEMDIQIAPMFYKI